MQKLHIKKGDTVKVLAGDSRGQEGKVLSVNREKMTAVVEGINMISKATRPNAQNPQGGIVKKEGSVHVSNLMIIDPSNGKPTRIGRKRDEAGKLVRYAKKSGEVIK